MPRFIEPAGGGGTPRVPVDFFKYATPAQYQMGGYSATESFIQLDSWGTSAVYTTTDTGSSSGFGQDGRELQQATSGAAGDRAFSASGSLNTPEANHAQRCKFRVDFGITDIRFVTGLLSVSLTDANVYGLDDPGANHIALQYSTARADSTFQISHRGAGAQVLVDTGVALVADDAYILDIIYENQASVIVHLLDNTETSLFQTLLTTSLPAVGGSTTRARHHCGLEALAGPTPKSVTQFFGTYIARGQQGF